MTGRSEQTERKLGCCGVRMDESDFLDDDKLKAYLKKYPEKKEALIKANNALKRYDVFKKYNGIHFYKSMPKTELFHKSEAPYRLLHGANRSSKSTTGGAEDVYYAMGIHPHKKVRTPNEGWVVSLSYKQQIEGVQPIIMGFLPKKNIKRITYIKSDVIDTIWVIPHGKPQDIDLEDCSKITFKSCDSGPRLFAGAAKRWIHFDEEPTYAIYKECIARIGAGVPLDIWLTMTPIFEEAGRKVGMTWTYREIYQKRDQKRIATFGVGIEDNIYLSKEQVEEQKKKYYGAEYDIRIKGEFRLLSGNQVFDVEHLEKQIDLCVAPKFKGRIELSNTGNLIKVADSRGYLSIWNDPKPGAQYCIGADSGLGVGSDPSAASIRDMRTLEQVATIKGQIPPDQFGDLLVKIGNYYNKAWLGIEANSFGIATIDSVKHRYSKLYYRYRVDRRNDQKTKQIGWWTDTKTKPIMIADYGQALRQETVIIKDLDLFNECVTYIIGEDGSANAESGCHDDLLISDMICFQVRKRFYMTSASAQTQQEYIPTSKTTGY